MADPELIAYIRDNLKQFGPKATREQLARDGVSAAEIDAAFVEAARLTPRAKRKLALVALCGGAVLMAVAAMLSMEPSPKDGRQGASGGDPSGAVFRGHYGYILKLPAGYEARGGFEDPAKTAEVVYIYKTGTDPAHFIHEGLYGHLGILRLEVRPRRVPQGYVGIDTLKSWVVRKLETDKASYDVRSLNVQGKPAFIVDVEKPFQYTRAYVVGQKVRYMLVGGPKDELLTEVLSSLVEADPHARPGK
ncbi:MAG: hypothetical protein ABII00_01245 [Elusimicrobiota bacterium]